MAKNVTPTAETNASKNYELYIMRHGIAVAGGTTEFSDDSKRPLTSQGQEKVAEIAKGLDRTGLDLDWVVTSPLVRAVQTGEIVAKTLSGRPPLDVSDALRPGGSAEDLVAFLAKRPNRRKVLVVGHEPDLSELASRLIGAGSHANLAFKKGGACMILFADFPPQDPGQLIWWLTPRLLRKLG